MIKENLRELTHLNGVSSQEDSVIDYVFDYFKKFNSDVEIDKIGNVISHYSCDVPNAKKLIVFAHTDEIGMIVRKIESNGFIRFERVGGVSTQILPGTVVQLLVESKIIKGVIGTPAHHFIAQSQKETIPSVQQMYIDIGSFSKEEVLNKGIDVGTMIVFDQNWFENDDVIFSKAIDNRVGISVLLGLAEKMSFEKPQFDLYLVAAVMEEFNIRGVMTAIRKIKPDVSIGIDITPSCDTPDLSYNNVSINNGPAITYMNFHGRGTLAGVLPSIPLAKEIEKIAKEFNIPLQKEVATGVITENAFIIFENEGVSVANLSIPTRYTHTPFEAIHVRDVELTVELLTKFILASQQGKKYDKERR